jgi:hypothetical protein
VHRVGNGEAEVGGDPDGVAVGGAAVEVEADEPGDVVGAWSGGDGGGVALLDDVAVLDDDQPVGQHQGVEWVVRDQQRRAGMAGEVAVQFGAGVQPGTGIQRGEGFVEQQQARMYGEGASQRHALGLSAGQVPGLAAGVCGQTDPVEPVGGLPAGGMPVHAVAARAERDVVQRAQVWKEQVVLEQHADRAAFGRGPDVAAGAVDVAAGQRDVPGGQWLQAGEGAQRGGLAGAVGAEQPDDFSGVDAQSEVEVEGVAVDDQMRVDHRVRVEVRPDVGHGLVIHLSRSAARMVTETVSRIRLRTIAASRSVSSAR